MSMILGCDCGYLLCDYEQRTHNSVEICKETGLSEQSIQILCNLNKWGFKHEAQVIDFLLFDAANRKPTHHFRSILNLLHFFFGYKNYSNTRKSVSISGYVYDDKSTDGFISENAIAINSRITITGHLDADQLDEMTVKDLKKLADDMGVKYGKNAKKDELVALIAAEPVQVEKAAIVEDDVDPDEANEAAPGMIVGVDLEADDHGRENDNDKEESVVGRVLVTYTGLVNMRDDQLHVTGQATQGQVFAAVGKYERDGKTWYWVEDQAGKRFLISADVVRFMA